MLIARLVPAILFLTLPFHAARSQAIGAAKTTQTTRKGPCDGAGTQAELDDCFSTLAKKADANLKTVYSHYLHILSGEDRSSLQKAQDAWLRYREAECRVSAGAVRAAANIR
jgi:uncharacterized protein YecT (DUF1311 family)